MNIAATVNFTDTANYQAIYSSQVYGTFFVVYGKFMIREEEGLYLLEGANLRVVNYKGLINVGITKAKLQIQLDMATGENIGGRLIIEIQGVPQNDPATTDVDVEINGVNNVIPFPKATSYLWVDRRMKRLHDRTGMSQDAENLLKNIFDEEFYYREGVVNSANLTDVDHAPNEWDSVFVFETAPGTVMCPRAKNKVI